MKNSINIATMTQIVHTLPQNVQDINHRSVDEMRDLSASIDEYKKPFYRIWHYIKQNWDTGYSTEELEELTELFGKLKSSQKMLSNVIWDMDVQGLKTIDLTSIKNLRSTLL